MFGHSNITHAMITIHSIITVYRGNSLKSCLLLDRSAIIKNFVYLTKLTNYIAFFITLSVEILIQYLEKHYNPIYPISNIQYPVSNIQNI